MALNEQLNLSILKTLQYVLFFQTVCRYVYDLLCIGVGLGTYETEKKRSALSFLLLEFD